jgi:hypothetical protein
LKPHLFCEQDEKKMNVDGPDHYTGAVECIDAMAAAYGPDRVRTFCQLNAFKYIWRMHTKDSPEENTRKAIWFLRYSLGDDPRAHREIDTSSPT